MTTTKLPFNLTPSDCEFPRPKKFPASEAWYQENRVIKNITLYRTERFGWVVCTLHIRNAGRARAGSPARSYGISERGEICTVGLGPHVLETLEVRIRANRAEALKGLIALHAKGEVDANSIRDRISSRRAQTSLRRSVFTSW